MYGCMNEHVCVCMRVRVCICVCVGGKTDVLKQMNLGLSLIM